MTADGTARGVRVPEIPDWVRDAVFYQIFPDRFAQSDRVAKPGPLEPWDAPPTHHGFKGGDLRGIAEHLDTLDDLGVTALYLTPVFSSASNHRYHTVDYYAVDPLLGGDDALRELLDAAHARGMRVVLDGVFNHASRGFWPFHHVMEAGWQSPYLDWFYVSDDVRAGRRGLLAYPTPRDVESIEHAQLRSGGERGAASRHVLGYEAWWDLPALPKLNHANAAVREHVYGAAEHWLRFGIDGWRLDVPSEITEPGFWEEFRRRVRAVNPEAYLVGELWNPSPEWVAGDRFDAVMNYPIAYTVLSFVGAGTLDLSMLATTHEYNRHVHPTDGAMFGRELTRVLSLYPPEVASAQLNLLDSHDTPRFLSLAGGDRSALRLAMLVLMTVPGAPCIYYGDEIGMEGAHDPDCRRAYPWQPDRQDAALRSFVRGLVRLRRSEPALRRGVFGFLGASGGAAAYEMAGDESSLIVALNAADAPVRLDLEAPHLAGAHLERVSWPGCDWQTDVAPGTTESGVIGLELRAREGMIVRARPVR